MCGRVAQKTPTAELARLFEAEDLVGTDGGRYNVAPTDPLAVIVEREGHRALMEFRWGLVPHWAESVAVGSRMINARAETIERSRAFRDSFARKRCLVPVDGFYEWLRSPDGRRQPFHITTTDGSPLALAGVWATWWPPEPDQPPIRSATIVTTTPNELLAQIHNRMPVILPPDAWSMWLDRDSRDRDELRLMLRPSPTENLIAYPVGPLVSNPRNEGPGLIAEVGLAP